MIFSRHFRSFVRKHWVASGAFVIAIGLAVWFIAAAVGEFRFFNDPSHKDVALRGWMTPKYVVLTYDLPRGFVADVLGLTDPNQARKPMRDIAEDMGVSLAELTVIVREAAELHRAGQK